MSALADLSFEHTYVDALPGDPTAENHVRQVHGAAFSKVRPTPVAAPTLLAWSPETAALLGISPEAVQSPEFVEAMGGNRLLPGMTPYANCYGGHQFGNWAGQLGDGRAITLGERVNPAGERYELQLKGAGPTPYARGADGRAVLRSSIREFLCSEAMFHLGVPTTRALTLVGTGDQVPRDMFYNGNVRPEPGAVVCRVAPSFLRFGSFQLPMSRQDLGLLEALARHTIAAHYPHLGPYSKTAVVAMLAEVAERTAEMVVHWMRVGFVHGVMNTDNMSMLGLTIDYGPYGWVDDYDPDWTPNTTDAHGRRYRFGHQPSVALWNLARLAEALFPLVNETDPLHEAVRAYVRRFEGLYAQVSAHKLGLAGFRTEAEGAVQAELPKLLTRVETDMSVFYRCLATVPTGAAAAALDDGALLACVQPAFYDLAALDDGDRSAWVAWLRDYAGVVAEAGVADAERVPRMNAVNPKYVLRNYLAQQAIEAAEKGDLGELDALFAVIRRPYDAQPGMERFAAKRPEWARDRPGCSTLSCSS